MKDTLVAVFDDEFLYELCLPAMEKYAGELGVTLNESVDETYLSDLK